MGALGATTNAFLAFLLRQNHQPKTTMTAETAIVEPMLMPAIAPVESAFGLGVAVGVGEGARVDDSVAEELWLEGLSEVDSGVAKELWLEGSVFGASCVLQTTT
jgi:hypothetical protein